MGQTERIKKTKDANVTYLLLIGLAIIIIICLVLMLIQLESCIASPFKYTASRLESIYQENIMCECKIEGLNYYACFNSTNVDTCQEEDNLLKGGFSIYEGR